MKPINLILIVVIGTLVYLNSLSVPFLFDDRSSVLENSSIRTLWPIWKALWAERQSVVAGRPVVNLSFALNYAMSGMNSWGYHLINLLIHLLNALCLYGIIRRTLLLDRWSSGTRAASSWLALSASLLWVVHPLLTEAVTYITQRTELLMALWFLLTLYCSIRGWNICAIVACALGMGSKEVMVSAPLIVVLYDWTFCYSNWRTQWQTRRRLYLGLAATWLLLAVLVASGPRSDSAGFHFSKLTPWQYALTQTQVILHYVRLAVWPHPLVLDYFDWPIVRHMGQVWWALAIIGFLIGVTLWGLRRRAWWGFLGTWVFLTLAPTSSILPIITEVAAERRMYLTLAGLLILVVLAGWSLLRQARLRQAAVIVLVAMLGGLTIHRNSIYGSEEAIWRDTVRKRPNNARALNNLGSVLWRHGQHEEATTLFRRAIELAPIYADAHSNYGNALKRMGKLEEAVESYQEAIRLKPHSVSAYNNLGNLFYQQGKLEEAARHFEQAISLGTMKAEPYGNLGAVRYRQGRLGEAEQHYRAALARQPTYVEAHNGLGVVLMNQRRLDEAIAQFQEALRLQPDHPRAQANLAAVQAKQASDGQPDELIDF